MKTAPSYDSFEELYEAARDSGKLPEAFSLPQSVCWDEFRTFDSTEASSWLDVLSNRRADAATNLAKYFLEKLECTIAGRQHYPVPVDEVRAYGAVIREPGNPYDANALRVYAVSVDSSRKTVLYRALGYVGRDTARVVSPILDQYSAFAVRVKFDTHLSTFQAQFDDPDEG